MPPVSSLLADPAALVGRITSRFPYFCAAVVGAALIALVAIAVLGETTPVPELTLVFLITLCLLGELLPIRLARRDDYDAITVSSGFAFALMLVSGPVVAVFAYAAVSAIADAVARLSPVKIAFNAAQYVLSMAAAAAVLALATETAQAPFATVNVPGTLLAGVTFFLVNHVLAGTAAALLSERAVGPFLRADIGFHVWTAGFQVALAPIVAAIAFDEQHLLPLLFCPMLATFLGGRQAIINQHLAHHDHLTDLPNRHMLSQRLAQRLEDREPFAVMLADLDDFKPVNDSLGHDLGDKLLQDVAERLLAAAPAGATVSRLGGDEFAILLPGADLIAAGEVAQRLRDALEQPFELGGFMLDASASIGISAYPSHGDNAAALLKRADLALYRAKESGTGFESFVDRVDAPEFDRLALAEQLRYAILNDELVLHYQPKLALGGNRRPHGVEALVRWQHPHLGLIGPDGFIPCAEQTNLIKPLTGWVIDRALRQCAEWRANGLDLRVAVNVSTRNLLDRALPDEVASLLEKWSVPAAALQLEITETKIVSDFGRAREVLERLRAVGVSVAIDDFGTGYSSLAQLQQLPADEIKIDRSFVRNMRTNPSDAAIVRSTIALGRNLSLEVTAEGVESEEICRDLSDLGCDFAQGYFLGRSVPADECERDIRILLREQGIETGPRFRADVKAWAKSA
ncbi:MAG: diguanylate cyclase/phosphodiesterase (GGDEF & EAL domains) with PAS/PAC sensor(s) [uncultured Solirubrobacteraceae bacterium]|uniref:Diguanylate cyclase/phosphodiesterase (GGDEF & EAL domains) with PAS/PAC sensor(S) n=1 Tax=uncultured Solirubrobacteraceae bacterium TaxID=1162706 RepID=A0A6J4RE34_9ACTN|nr:MAG: diguanylate cyclase/phosphodiesterase (GGDEF & EAL domains) with PAS/PAC sensor(s) [uncultured Solirubrobacteraceae bacterium]